MPEIPDHLYARDPNFRLPPKRYTMSMAPHTSVPVEKQQRILDIIDRWKTYQVDTENGFVFRMYNRGNISTKARKIKHYLNDAGRPNFHIHYRFGNEGSDYEVISCFHLMWLVAHGPFDPKLRLRPIDGDWLNYKRSNITVDLPIRKERVEGDKVVKPPLVTEFKQKVRYEEIRQIRSIMIVNTEVRPIDISRLLKLNYFSVQRAMDRIRRGLKLRFESEGPYRQEKDPYMHFLPTDI